MCDTASIPGSPSDLRQRALDRLVERAPGAVVVAFQVDLSRGAPGRAWCQSAGEAREGCFDPDRAAQACAEAVASSSPRGRGLLTRASEAVDRAVFGAAAAEGGSVARRLVFDGERLVAYVGLCTPGQALREELLCRCNTLRAELAQRLIEADRRARAPLPNADGDLVLRPSGAVSHATPGGQAWLAVPAVALGLVRRLEAQAEQGWPSRALRERIGGAAAELTRLDGEGGALIHVRLSPVEPLRLRPCAQLTPRQREVGDFAAAGATVPQIASATGLSAETVRTHLRAIYTRLEVGSRVELAAALRDGAVSGLPACRPT